MKVAIVGANGFIGRNATRWFPNSVLITRRGCTQLPSDVDWIIHCAAEGGSRLSEDSTDVTYKNLKSYCEYARLGIPMVYFSSGAAMWNPDSPYGFSKLMIENMNHPHVKIVRLFGCYGPYEKPTRFTAAVARGHVTIHQDRFFDFVHVHDVMRIVESIIKDPVSFSKVTDAAPPGLPKLLSEFASEHGAEYTIEREGLATPYIANRALI